MTTPPESTPAVWVDGDPLMEAVASAVYEQCRTVDGGIVDDDPRNIAAVAVATFRTAAGGSATDQAAVPPGCQPSDCCGDPSIHLPTGDGGAGDERRDRYAAAILAALARDTSRGPNWGSAADAVLAVADAEQRKLRRALASSEGIRENADFHLGQEMARRQLAEKEAARLRGELGQARTTRATVLRERADFYEGVLRDSLDPDSDPRYCTAVHDIVLGLRRLAAADTTNTAPEPEVVAYRNSHQPGVLLCRGHGWGWAGLTPLTSEDLPDGGACTFGDPGDPDDRCGVDVLIPATGTAPATDGGGQREQRYCGSTPDHPSHLFMRMEVVFQCPGTVEPATMAAAVTAFKHSLVAEYCTCGMTPPSVEGCPVHGAETTGTAPATDGDTT